MFMELKHYLGLPFLSEGLQDRKRPPAREESLDGMMKLLATSSFIHSEESLTKGNLGNCSGHTCGRPGPTTESLSFCNFLPPLLSPQLFSPKKWTPDTRSNLLMPKSRKEKTCIHCLRSFPCGLPPLLASQQTSALTSQRTYKSPHVNPINYQLICI